MERPIDAELYQPLEQQALARIGERDPEDWPALACAVMLSCPVWRRTPTSSAPVWPRGLPAA